MMLISVLILFISFNYVICADDGNCDLLSSKTITGYTQASVIDTLLKNAKTLLEDAQKYAASNASCRTSESRGNKPADCAEILENESTAISGVHKIWPRNRVLEGPIEVYCDMEDSGGGWTVLQRRGDFDSDKSYFYQDWIAYKNGFGDLVRDFWLGNDNIFYLTNQRLNKIKFTLADWDGNKTYAEYDQFWIDGELHKYTGHVKGYRGTAGDGFSYTNGVPFSTKDQDNDSYAGNCAVAMKGAWWYASCHFSNLNGQYLRDMHKTKADGINWESSRYSLKETVIKIRPKNFKNLHISATPH